MLKHNKHEHPSSSHITGMTSNSVQHMIECNSTISSKSKSNEATIFALTSTFVDSSTITYQYHQFNHFDSPPNQFYLISQYFPTLCWWCTWHSMECGAQ